MRRFWVVLLAVFLMALPAMADQVDGLASSSQSAPAQLQDLYVNPGGLGDVLVFPYYNARTGLDYFRIVNTSDKGIIGKLRLREGKESKEVLDFIVCLSPHDEFTFWVVDPAVVGLTGNTAVVLRGNSGTGLMADTDTVVAPGGWTVAATRTITSGGQSIDAARTFEGYVEFFALKAIAVADSADFHSKIPDAAACLAAAKATEGYEDAPNALMGEAYIFNLNTLDSDGVSTYAYKAVAFANFQDSPMAAGLTTDRPLFADAKAGLMGVNYVLAKKDLYAFYDLQNYLQGQTDLILNFVTKKENIDNGYASIYYDSDKCVSITAKVYDDKENFPTSGVDFSPVPPGQKPRVCNEVTYLPVGSSSTILNTQLKELSVATSYQLGWLQLSFDKGESTVGDFVAYGQPVLAYQLQSYFGGIAADRMLPLSYEPEISSSGEQQGGGQQGQGASTTINGVTVDCNTDCAATFGSDIVALTQCAAWQSNNCQQQ